jgi:hypothetical protein
MSNERIGCKDAKQSSMQIDADADAAMHQFNSVVMIMI